MPDQQQQKQPSVPTRKFQVSKLEDRIAPSNANFPPGQFPSGNPAHAPGDSNPNEVPSNTPGHSK